MKKLTVGIISVVAITVIGIVTLNFALTPLVNQFRPEIEAQIETAIKQPVTFDQLSVQFLPYVGITLSNVKLENASDQNKIGRAVLRASLLDIFQGNVTVSELNISDTVATITKDQEGNLTIGGIALNAKKEAIPKNSSVTGSTPSQSQDAGAALALIVKQAAITNTAVRFIDQSVEPAQTIDLKDIDIEVFDISTAGNGTIRINANLLSDHQNVEISGKVGIIPAENGIPPLDLAFSIADFNFAELEKLALAYAKDLKALPLSSPLKIAGKVGSDTQGLKAEINLTGSQPLNIAVQLTSLTPLKGNATIGSEKILFADIAKAMPGLVVLKDSSISGLNLTSDFALNPTNATAKLISSAGVIAGAPLQSLAINTTIHDSTIEINPSSIKGLGGEVTLQGNLSQADPKALALKANAKSLDLAQLSQVALSDSPVSLRGTVTNLAVDVTGNQTDIPNSLAGNIKLDAVKGALVGFNFFAEVVGAMEEIPGISESIEKSIPEEHRKFLAAKDTAFDAITARITLGNKEARIEQLDMTHSLYIVAIKGYTKFDGKLRIEGALKLTPPLTTQMVERNKRFKLLLDQSQNIVIPIVLSRSSDGRVKVYPDTKELAKLAAGAVVEEKASKALNKISPGLGGVVKGLGGLFK